MHHSSPTMAFSDDHDNTISHQPIMLTRSDTFHQPTTSPSSTTTSEHSSPTQQKEKRKWDQVTDGLSKNVPKHDSLNRSYLPIDNDIRNSSNEKVMKDDVSQDSDGQHSSSSSLNGKKPGRKPLADDEASDDDDDPKVKRKTQNRMAQRNFRERREKYLRDLELKLKQAQDTHNMATAQLCQENHHLRSIICRLENENVVLKSIHVQQGKPVQEWIQALHDHQQRIINDPMSSSSPPAMVPLLPTTPTTTFLPSNVGSPVSSERSSRQQMQYTFAISTPDTLRTRKKRQQSNRSPSPPSPSGKKPPARQLSPVELVRLYPYEHRSDSPASAATTSAAQTPTMDCQVFCDKLQQVCTNPFDQLLSEPLFDTTGGLNETLGYPHDSLTHMVTLHKDATLSGQQVWDRLHRHARFAHYSSNQLIDMVKSMTKCTDQGPVLTEQDVKIILDKMDQGRV